MEAEWNSDFHMNINLQMHYWLPDVANISECHEPYFDFLESLVEPGRKMARDMFHCGGFCTSHTTDAWRYTAMFGKTRYGAWTLGGAWCTRLFMDHYRFTGDMEFLRGRAYPILKEAALFLNDWLVENPKTGKLVSGPSTSPENQFVAPDGIPCNITMGCSMDQQIAWDVLSN